MRGQNLWAESSNVLCFDSVNEPRSVMLYKQRFPSDSHLATDGERAIGQAGKVKAPAGVPAIALGN